MNFFFYNFTLKQVDNASKTPRITESEENKKSLVRNKWK